MVGGVGGAWVLAPANPLFLNSCSPLSIFPLHATMPHHQVMHVVMSYNLCTNLFMQPTMHVNLSHLFLCGHIRSCYTFVA